MAFLYITQGRTTSNTGAQALVGPILGQQKIPIGGSATPSDPFHGGARLVRIHVDGDGACSIAVGPNAIATTNDMRLAPNQTEYFGVNEGDVISVIANN